MPYILKEVDNAEAAAYTPYGGAAEFLYCHDPEVIIHGPAQTGKTLAACHKIHIIAGKYPGAQIAILRKTQTDVYGSVLQTFNRVIAGSPVMPYGGVKPEQYIYPEDGGKQSIVWVGGMDKAGKVLSSERDLVYVNQAEQLSLDDWENLSTRTTGRSAIIPYPQLMGDANPGGSKHWIRERNKAGSLKLIQSLHKDNPTLFNPETGQITELGQKTISSLEKLTGIRRKRLYEGIWATAEGAVYDMFDASVHVKARPDSEMVSWYLAIDEGYTNPAVILLVGVDVDGRWHIKKEWYERGKLQSEVVRQAVKLCGEYDVTLAAVDAAAAGLIADLIDANVPAEGAKGRVLDGIHIIQDKLQVQSDGRPRLTVDPSCVETINEYESYVWKTGQAGAMRDEPQKENDHAMDASRYLGILLETSEMQLF